MTVQLWPADEPVVVDGDGVRLREWDEADAAVLVRLFDTEHMNRWTPLPSPFTHEVARGYVARAHELRREDGTLQLAILPAPDAEPVGEVILFPAAEPNAVEIAYAVGAQHQRQGFASRAVAAVLDVARQAGARHARLTIALGNSPSAAVARAAGFAPLDGPTQERRRKGFVLQMQTWQREL